MGRVKIGKCVTYVPSLNNLGRFLIVSWPFLLFVKLLLKISANRMTQNDSYLLKSNGYLL